MDSEKVSALEWRTIESAPADGTDVLVWHEQWPGARLVQADGDWWRYAVRMGWFAPTRWMPLPQPPTNGEAK